MWQKLIHWLFPQLKKQQVALVPSKPIDFVLRKLNPKGYALGNIAQINLEKTASIYLQICKIVGHAPKIDSGYRSGEEQATLYRRLGKTNKPGSAHCIGAAMDLADVDGNLFKALSTPEVLLQLGIYLEAKSATPTWVHVQHTAPRSGKRVFNP